MMSTEMFQAEISEQIQQLRATISILTDQNTRRTKSPNTQNDEHKGKYCKAKTLQNM